MKTTRSLSSAKQPVAKTGGNEKENIDRGLAISKPASTLAGNKLIPMRFKNQAIALNFGLMVLIEVK